jgi:transposase
MAAWLRLGDVLLLDHFGMSVNVRAVDREQVFLMPPSIDEWLPDGHLAWFVLDVIAELDLSAFLAEFRVDGRGGAVYDPAVMLAVLVYGYCVGERSSRRIERRLVEDVAFRVLAANQHPDHATLARFRRRHESAIAALFAQVLGLCVSAGLVDAGLVAIDGTKMAANASAWANRTREQLAREVLAEAEAVDAAEDAEHGDARGDELPAKWADRRDRRARVREALRQLDAEGSTDWDAYQRERAEREAELGRKLPGRKAKPGGRRTKRGHANVTDPDSRMLRSGQSFVQGYNAQAAVTGEQIVVAAEVTNAANDTTQFQPLLATASDNLTAAGCTGGVGAVVADAGYWSTGNALTDTDATILIATTPATNGSITSNDPRLKRRAKLLDRLDRGQLTIGDTAEQMGISYGWARQLLLDYRRHGRDPAVVRAEMEDRLAEDTNAGCYAKRKTTVEPVFGDIKKNKGYRGFSRRGLAAVDSEWKLICTTLNVLKLWRAQPATG